MLLCEVFLEVFALLDGVLGAIYLFRAELPLGVLLLLLLLQLRQHLVHDLLDLGKGIQAHVHRQRGECPALLVLRRHGDSPHGPLHGAIPQSRRGADLHEAHGFGVQIAGIILREDLQGLGQRTNFLSAHRHALLVFLVLLLAVLLQGCQEGLVGGQRLLHGLLLLLGLGGLVQEVSQCGLLLRLLSRGGRNLRQLRCTELLEGHLSHEVLLLSIKEVAREFVLHFAEDAQDAAATGVVGLGACCLAHEAVGLAHETLLEASSSQERVGLSFHHRQRAEHVEKIVLHPVLELGETPLEGVTHLQQCDLHLAGVLVGGLPLLLQQLHLLKDLNGLAQKRPRLLHVGLLCNKGLVLRITQADRTVHCILVIRDVVCKASNLGLQSTFLGRGLFKEGGKCADALLCNLDGCGLLLPVRRAPTRVLLVCKLICVRVLLCLHLHLLEQRDDLSDGAHLWHDG
mmetsp:Transcript_19958/g.46757  ORF Transcript_19958/g.46757 Transcript_19958/m.46757 type:complete len:457 (-) Transcript_19958:184-1554(-)